MNISSTNTISQAAIDQRSRHWLEKLFAALYSMTAYLAFFATILYAIGFVGNFIVPKSVDSGFSSTSYWAIAINTALLSMFAAQHSIMARPFFKRWITRFIPTEVERSTYVLLSNAALALVFWQWQPMSEVIWSVENTFVFYLISTVYFLGWAVVFLSSFMINHFELFGLQQVYNYCREKQTVALPFTTRYFYTFVRHPLMLGFLIAMWAAPVMSAGHLLFTVITTLYIVLAVKNLEEKDLRQAIGEEYARYQREVPMLIPCAGSKSV